MKYDEQHADVSQALGMAPESESWYVAGRTLAWRQFWAKFKSEAECYRFLDRTEAKHSHLIEPQFADLTDAWALEAIKLASDLNIEVAVTRVGAAWSVRAHLRNASFHDAAIQDPCLAQAVKESLFFALGLNRTDSQGPTAEQ